MQDNLGLIDYEDREWQCMWSPTLGALEDTHQNIWGTREYTSKDDPIIFMGVYSYIDFLKIWSHAGRKAILWCGGDIVRLTETGYWLHDSPVMALDSKIIAKWINENCENYCENIWEYETLKKIGIESIIVPSFLGRVEDYEMTFKPGNRVYASVSGDNFEEYGWHKIEAIARLNKDIDFYLYGNTKEWKTENKNVFVRGRVDKRVMNEEIKHMQGAIRLVEKDGFSEILAKSILWGQWPIAEIEYPYMLRPHHLRMILDKQKPNEEGRKYYLSILNSYPWNFYRDIKKIIIDRDDKVIFENGRVPLDWSWEETTNRDMPAKAFILYLPMRDGMEMRQIYVSKKNRKEGVGSKILKIFEEKSKELGKNKIYIKVHFTSYDPDNIFQDFLKNQGYKETETDLWTKTKE